MANNGIIIKVELDENGAVKSLKKLEHSIDDVEKADDGLKWNGIEEGETALNDTAKSAKGLEDSIDSLKDMLGEIAGAAAAAVGIGAFASYANESSEASARLSATLAGTGQDVEAFDKAMQSLYAQNYGESFDDIAEAANQVIQIVGQDISPAALESITKSAIVLRDTFGIDIPESTKAAQVMMDNFGMTSEQAFDMLARGAQEGLNINGDMLDSFSEYSPYFKQLGLDATDMFNAFASGADISMYGVDKAGDAFKEFGIRVVDGSDSTLAAFEAIGLSADEYAQKIMEGGDTARQATSEIINGLLSIEDPVERNMQGVALFGTQWEDLGQDGAEAMLALMGQAVNCEGTLAAIDDVRYDSLGGCIGEIGRAFEVSLMQPLVDTIMPALSNFTQWFTDNQTVIVPIIGGIAAAFGVLAAAMSIHGLIQRLSGAFDALNTVMKKNPIVLIVSLLAGLVTAFVVLWNNCEEFRNFWIDIWDSVMAAVQPIADWVMTNVITPLMDYFQEFQTTFSALWDAVVVGISNALQLIAPMVQNVMANIKGAIETAMPMIQAIWSAAWGVISIVFVTIWNAIEVVVTTVMGVIQGVITTVTGIISGDWSMVWEGIRQVFESVWNGIGGIVQAVLNGIVEFINVSIQSVYNVWTSIWNAVYATVSSIWNSISSTITGIAQGIWSAITGTFNNLWNSVSSIFRSIRDAMCNPIETAKNTISGIIDTIKGFFNNFHIQLPHINLPHFSINPPGWQIGDLLQGTIPSLGIEWYAKGGMFNGPSVIGVGEAGPEAVLPLSNKRAMHDIGQAISETEEMGDLSEVIAELRALHQDLPRMFATYCMRALVVNGREFARLVQDTEGLI